MTGNHASHPHSRFDDSEQLRTLLRRLHAAGPGAWRHDRDADALMEHVAQRYAALARKHNLGPWDAAAAAFEAMRTRAARHADDPWAVITRAVQITLGAEEKATGMLVSPHQARRRRYAGYRRAMRLSDRDTSLLDWHPAFQIHPHDRHDDDPETGTASQVAAAVDDAVALFTLLGWPAPVARTGVDYICSRLADAGSRVAAYEALRRDRQARALLDIEQDTWTAMLRVVLGTPQPHHALTAAGRGILVRLLIGQTLTELLNDDDLVLTVSLNAPGRTRGGAGG
ncbi:hypothetical protein [Jiangella alkaliphila]|uniref:Uncharacterized protein n=1 Tax=Jiangella alkaliphila TaxID=419479 RepID=A0A1H2L971_9ACTN|nr:hypothetical protein [Jiangella alkaliphila]SDU77121.1 hypothetical protein SAMN04488563_5426 [Jiangella alkaliphila]